MSYRLNSVKGVIEDFMGGYNYMESEWTRTKHDLRGQVRAHQASLLDC